MYSDSPGRSTRVTGVAVASAPAAAAWQQSCFAGAATVTGTSNGAFFSPWQQVPPCVFVSFIRLVYRPR
jgi:hypothetical protein